MATKDTHSSDNRRESHTRIDGEPDRRYENNGQGAVKDPEHDGRLVENREKGVSMQDGNDDDRDNRRDTRSSRDDDRSDSRSSRSSR